MDQSAIDLQNKYQEESIKIRHIQGLIQEALCKENLLEDLNKYKTFNQSGIEAIIRSYQGCQYDFIDWVRELTIQNMKSVYDASYEWSEEAKAYEQSEANALYLIAESNDSPIGFVHFRFEDQERSFVLFLYDIQIEPKYQNSGLGTFLMSAIEALAYKNKVDSIMTLVFKANESGMRFFNKLGFQPAKSSPENIAPEKASEFKHVILYKPIMKDYDQ